MSQQALNMRRREGPNNADVVSFRDDLGSRTNQAVVNNLTTQHAAATGQAQAEIRTAVDQLQAFLTVARNDGAAIDAAALADLEAYIGGLPTP